MDIPLRIDVVIGIRLQFIAEPIVALIIFGALALLLGLDPTGRNVLLDEFGIR